MAGDATASRREFEVLLEPVLDPLFGTALRMTRNRSDAEDVVQESVMKAWRSFDRFQTGTNFKAWIFKILANTFISGKRTDKRRPQPSPLQDGGAEISASAEGDSYDAAEWNRIYSSLVDDDVKRALDELPDEFRVPLLLSSLGDLSYKEMAVSLDVPVGTIMSRLFRARERLRLALKDYAGARGIRLDSAPAAEGR